MKWNQEKIKKDLEELTIELIKVKSINGTYGEVEISNKIEKIIKNIHYFNEYPKYLWTKTVENDKLKRKTVFALLESKKKSNKTILLHAHSDTVTTDDFGELKELANYPEKLMKEMKKLKLSEDVKRDLDSGNWLFGRGSVDMKSGIAVHLLILKYFAENRNEFTGNILFMANPIEETTHGGIIDAVHELKLLQKEKKLSFECAINTDFVGPQFKNDNKRYIYLGSVGKLLPAFYIKGSETHVAQAFEGLDPNLISSELVKRISLNSELADEAEGEYTVPPTTLKQSDLKPTYNVQTPFASYVYFNYFVHQISPEKVLEQLFEIAQNSFDEVLKKLNIEYYKYCQKISIEYEKLPWKAKVITYYQLFSEVYRKYGDEVYSRLNKVLNLYANKLDPREVGRLLVEELLLMDDDNSPVIVLFFATPYVPRNFVKNRTAKEKNILKKLFNILEGMENVYDDKFEVNKFFPSLTDSSYLSIDNTDEEINYLQNNFPGMNKLYPVPIDKIRKLNIPSINIGSWGKDAHKKTERVYKPYTFGVLPNVIKSLIESILD